MTEEIAYATVWRAAEPYMRFRRNDIHIPIVYSYAEQLVELHPDCDPDVVLLGALLHDIGWAAVDQEELYATAFKADVTDVRIQHEKEGARMAREILEAQEYPAALVDEIHAIIDGHDTRKTALSLNDSLVKDADKLWRFTPIGIAIAAEWFEWTPTRYAKKIEEKDIPLIFNEASVAIARKDLEDSKRILKIAVL